MARQHANIGKREAAADRRIKALDLRKKGKSYRQIGQLLGISYQQAQRDVEASLVELSKQELRNADVLRQLELERLDMATDFAYSFAASGSVSHIESIRRTSESRRKLLGLDAPEKHINFDVSEELAHQLIDLLAARGIDASDVFNAMIAELQDADSARVSAENTKAT